MAMKKISHLSTVSSLIVLVFIIPQIAFAAWWNPISWFSGWNFFHKTDIQTQVLEDRVKELEKNLDNASTSTPTKTTPTTVTPKRDRAVTTPVVTVTRVQSPGPSTDSQLLTVEKCKAKREITRGTLWPAFLQAVAIKEQKYQQTVMDVLSSYRGTVSSSVLGSAIAISPAEHEKNLELAETAMEGQLAKEYSACLNGS